jgi:hypothetical protein
LHFVDNLVEIVADIAAADVAVADNYYYYYYCIDL